MSYRLDGQPLRQIQGSYFNEMGDKHRKDRESYFGIIGAAPTKKELYIKDNLLSYDTYGERPKPYPYHTGLNLTYENDFAKRYQGHLSNAQLHKDANPYHDRYTVNVGITPKPQIIPLNNGTMVGGRLNGGCDCQSSSEEEYMHTKPKRKSGKKK